jgi:hypothetical protein
MGKFRKKPVVIEAEQYVGARLRSPDLQRALCICEATGMPHIHTLEGVMLVSDGDWIICGVKGEVYPCKPDIFAATYEAVETRDPGEGEEGTNESE